MAIIDAHCDVLSKLLVHPELDFVRGQEGLDVTFERMRKSGIRVQNFAVYLPERWSAEFRYVLEASICSMNASFLCRRCGLFARHPICVYPWTAIESERCSH